ncbi:hypothetical protein CBS101457_000418 [Exobasidium rhododendri]|nr:hypothetical protein CBS101457_000418 [Exobasidium rhododendri]
MGLSRTSKDVLSGTSGGVAQVFVGQPLDICKVRLQTAPKGTYTGLVDCASQIFRAEGPIGFYRGTLTPLLGVGACVSIQFGVVEAVKRYFQEVNDKKNHEGGLSGFQLYQAGAAAGIANSFIAGPVEQIRIRLQTQQNRSFSGPLDCARKIVQQSGFSGLFRGITPTLLREGHGLGVYFLTYEALVQQQLKRSGKERKDLPATMAMLFGASAGVALWLSAYPLDVVKSRMQTDHIGPSQRQFRSSLDCAKQIYKTAGFSGFLRGLTPTLVRAPFANAATFVVYEYVSQKLERYVTE